MRAFNDASTGLWREGLVGGTETAIDMFIPKSQKTAVLTVSDSPFDGCGEIVWQHRGFAGQDIQVPSGVTVPETEVLGSGNTYSLNEHKLWLCSNLFKYFGFDGKPPNKLYFRVV